VAKKETNYILGIDAGSSYIKLVLIDPAGGMTAKRIVQRGSDFDETCRRSYDQLLSESNLSESQIGGIIATGYGRRQVGFADEVITEITALAVGGRKVAPDMTVVIDIGGQDSKVIALDDSSGVVDFAMNQKCAAGTGKFLEITSASLGVDVAQLGPLSQKADQTLTLTSTCTVFAESEIVSHIAAGETKENIIKALHRAIAKQIMGLYHQVGTAGSGQILFVGGVALNSGMVVELSERLGCQVIVPPDPQYIGAYGAALYLRNKK
jgi:predicted CoA-substrate-specific enzyme activase